MRRDWRRLRRSRFWLRRSNRIYLWAFGGAFLLAWHVSTGEVMYPIAAAAAALLGALGAPSLRRLVRRASPRRRSIPPSRRRAA